MKNSYFEATVQDAARYIAERNVVYIPHIQLDDKFKRIERGRTDKIHWSMLEKNTMEKPIETRMNVFPNENKIRIIIGIRKYKLSLKYVDNYAETMPFEFILPQEVVELEGIIFENLKHSITDIDGIIDYKMGQIVNQDVKKIFNKYRDIDIMTDKKNKWYLTTESELDIHLEKLYRFD